MSGFGRRYRLTPLGWLLLVGMTALGGALGSWLWWRPVTLAASPLSPPLPTPTRGTSPYPGDLAPEFDLPALDGGRVSLSQHRGYRVVLNFFASWCEACREEMPGLQAQAAAHSIHDWVVLGIDVMETPAEARSFKDEFGLTFPLLLDEAGAVTSLYAVAGLPTSLFIDRAGQIVERRTGYMSEADLADQIANMP